MSECWNIYRAVLQKFTISQRFFLHFYIVAFIWTTLLLLGTWAYAYNMVPLVVEPFSYSTITSFLTGGSTIKTDTYKLRQGYVAWQAVFLLLMMEVQVLRRLYETRHVFNYSPSARMHVIGYLTGLLWVFLFIVPQSASLAIAFWNCYYYAELRMCVKCLFFCQVQTIAILVGVFLWNLLLPVKFLGMNP